MRLAERDRRAVLAGTVAVAVILLYAGGVRPVQKLRAELIARREMSAQTLLRYRELAQAGPAYAAAADTARIRLERLIPGVFIEDPQDATNRLVEMLERAARASDVRIFRAAPAPPDSAGTGLVRIGASLECESDLAALLTFLHALEAAQRLLHVSGLRISTAGGWPREVEVEVLRAGFTVSAFVLVPLSENDDAGVVFR